MFEDAALLITDLALTEPAQLVPVLEKCVRGGIKRLVILAKEVSDKVIGLLVNNNKAKTIETVAVRTPRVLEMERVAAMEDIAALAGGKIFYSVTRDTLETFQVENLGRARRAWATESLFGLFGGKGDPRRLRQHLANIRSRLLLAEEDNDKRTLQQRLGRLAGGTAILRIGGATELEIETRKGVAERAVTNLRSAVQGGVVPGGGAALLAGQAALADLPAGCAEEAVAYKILARALEEPMRTIARNAGANPDIIVEKVKACPPGHGYDARRRQIVDMREAGILDPALMLAKALDIAVSGAAMALTTDVIVHHSEPKETVEP
jgi:chaperonin GroEL